jgi:hypothetical protein
VVRRREEAGSLRGGTGGRLRGRGSTGHVGGEGIM